MNPYQTNGPWPTHALISVRQTLIEWQGSHYNVALLEACLIAPILVPKLDLYRLVEERKRRMSMWGWGTSFLLSYLTPSRSLKGEKSFLYTSSMPFHLTCWLFLLHCWVLLSSFNWWSPTQASSILTELILSWNFLLWNKIEHMSIWLISLMFGL